MVTVPTNSNRQVAPGVLSSQVGGLGADASSFGLIGASQLVQDGQLIGKIADDEVAKLKDEAKVKMMASVSNFSITSQENLIRFQNEGTGDQTLVQAAMQDAQTRADELIAQQPQFLQADTSLQLLPKQVSVAKTAINIQEVKRQADIDRNIGEFSDNLINARRFGNTDEATAIEQARTFASLLPAFKQKATEETLTQGIRDASLFKAVEDDPRQTIKDIEAC